MPIYKLNARSSKIEACSLKIEDFKALFRLLNNKVDEALDIELEESPMLENKPENEVEQIRNSIRQNFKLSVLIVGAKGEYLSGDDVSIFEDENLPNNINQVIFDSAINHTQMIGREPRNKVIVQFDFKKQEIFDFSYLPAQPDPNSSSIQVGGYNDTWVSGVYAEILSFLKDKKKKRNWLHKKRIYDFFLYLLFYPIMFWCIYRVSSLLQGKVNTIFLIAVCFYIFFLLLLLLRIIFNYARWIFPLLEFIPKPGTKMGRHRATLSIIALGIISSLIRDIIKSIF